MPFANLFKKAEGKDRRESGALVGFDPLVTGILLVAFVGGALVLVVFGFASKSWIAAATMSIWSLAFTAAGCWLGFLFGIPRVLQGNPLNSSVGETPKQKAVDQDSIRAPDYSLLLNTNLEQISDWLCKIIIGLGLVQILQLNSGLESFASQLSVGADGAETLAHKTFVKGIAIYFSILGFMSGYLVTRLYLTGAISLADRAALAPKVQQVAEKQESMEEVIRKIDKKMELYEATTDGVLLLGGKLADRNRDGLIRRVEIARDHFRENRRGGIVLARLYRHLRKDIEAAIRVLGETLEAMEAAKMGDSEDARAVAYNRSCYYAVLLGQARDEARRDQLRDLALNDLKKACSNDENNRRQASTDPDFDAIKNHETFKNLIGQWSGPIAQSNSEHPE